MTIHPKESEVEVTVLGTGGGYGESIVIKANDSWIIVDSCTEPSKSESLPIEYLKRMEVDLNKVELIICTHWHNDHIRGLSDALQQCQNAEFSFASVHDLEKFLFFCELDYKKLEKGAVGSTNEFVDCVDIILERGKDCILAQCNQVLFSKKGIVNYTLYALSPSPRSIKDFHVELGQLLTDFGTSNTAMPKNTPNDKSVALLLSFGNHRVLLGADLEQGSSDKNGWKHIVNHCIVIDDIKANLFKISHHGSSTGYIKEIFDVLVNNDGILKLTPFSSSSLPRKDMIDVYKKHSNTIYSTAELKAPPRPKRRDMSLEKFIDRVGKVSEIKYNFGIIRSRIDCANQDAQWQTELFGTAVGII